MPSLRDLWGDRPLSDLAAQVGIPFRRLEAYVAAERPFSPADRTALAAFFAVDPATLTNGAVTATGSQREPKAAARTIRHAELPPVPVVRSPRPADVPPPTSIVTNQGTTVARITGVLQRAPEPAPDSRSHRPGATHFCLLELLVPHQPLRGAALYPPIKVICAVHRRQFDPFRWLHVGDKIIVTGTAVPRGDHLYVFAATLSTPRAERLGDVLMAWHNGTPDAEVSLVKLLGDDWPALSVPNPGSGVQMTRPPWTPSPVAPVGPQGRIQLTLNGQLQRDPVVALDETTGGTAELNLSISPPQDEGRLPVIRYHISMRLRTLRDFLWLQRGDSVVIHGDLARLGPEVLVEATTIQTSS